MCGLRFSQCGLVSDVRAWWLSCGIWLWASYWAAALGESFAVWSPASIVSIPGTSKRRHTHTHALIQWKRQIEYSPWWKLHLSSAITCLFACEIFAGNASAGWYTYWTEKRECDRKRDAGRGETEKKRVKRRFNAVKGLVNSPPPNPPCVSCRIPGCVGV